MIIPSNFTHENCRRANIYGNTGTTLVSGVAGSVASAGTYVDVLQGMTSISGIAGATGTYANLNYSLVADTFHAGDWNLVFVPAATNITIGATDSTANLGTTVNPKLDGGTLQVAATGTITTPLTITTNNGQIDQHGLSSTFSGIISNDSAGQAGKLIITNSGTGGLVNLNALNTYTGGTEVEAGATLAIASGTAIGTGSLSLVGSNSIPATLDITATTVISNAITVVGDPVFSISPNTTTTISSPIVDGGSPGDVVVQGGGTLNLTAINTYTGLTSIAAGSFLALNGSGSIANSNALTNNGAFNITGANATVKLGGSYTQTSTGTLAMALSPAQANLLSVTGSAALDGTLSVTPSPGTYRRGMHYTILTSPTVNGTFATVTDNAPSIVTFSLLYNSSAVQLTVTDASSSSFATSATTANQRNVAMALDRLSPLISTGPFNTVLNNLAVQNSSNQQLALDQLTSAVGANLQTAGAANMRTMISGVQSRFVGSPAASGSEAPLLQTSLKEVQVADASDSWFPLAMTVVPSNLTAWIQGFGDFNSIKGNSTAPGLNSTVGGGSVGVESKLDIDSRAGVMFGAANNQISVSDLPQSGTQNTYAFGVYGATGVWGGSTDNGIILDGMALAGYNNATTDRQIAVAGATAHGESSGFSMATAAGAGYPITLEDGSILTPHAGLTYTYNYEDAYTETGAPEANLAVKGNGKNLLQSSLGATLSHKFEFSDGTDHKKADALTPEVHAGWLHELINPGASIGESFDSVAGSAFTTNGAVPARDSAALGIGLSFTPGSDTNASMYARYETAHSHVQTDQSIVAGFRYSW